MSVATRRPESRSGTGQSDADVNLPDESSASPSDRGRRNQPPEENQVGELNRLLKKTTQELDQLKTEVKEQGESSDVVRQIRDAVTGKKPAPQAETPIGPMPDQYDDPEGYADWLDKKIDARAAERVQNYDVRRRQQDAVSRREELDQRTTDAFVESRGWLQNDDGSPSDEAMNSFQEYITESGIEGRGPDGSLTLKQLERAERSYSFEDIMAEEGSRMQREMVQGRQDRSRAGRTPRGQASYDDFGSIVSNDPRRAVDILRSSSQQDVDSYLDNLSLDDRRKLIPHLPDADR